MTLTLGSKARLTDPCYDKSVGCNAVLNVLPGDWEVEVINDGEVLLAYHISYPASLGGHGWEAGPDDLGVDSGQIGIFNEDLYPEDPGDYEDGTFYMAACEACQGGGDFVEFDDKVVGFATSTCYGDGTYKAGVQRNTDGLITAIAIGLD
jgi:hypothetical protein